MVPHQVAQSAAVGSPRSPAPKMITSSAALAAWGPRSTTNWSMQIRPRLDTSRGGNAGGRVDPVGGDADADQIEACLRNHEGGGRIAEMSQLRLESGAASHLFGVDEGV